MLDRFSSSSRLCWCRMDGIKFTSFFRPRIRWQRKHVMMASWGLTTQFSLWSQLKNHLIFRIRCFSQHKFDASSTHRWNSDRLNVSCYFIDWQSGVWPLGRFTNAGVSQMFWNWKVTVDDLTRKGTPGLWAAKHGKTNAKEMWCQKMWMQPWPLSRPSEARWREYVFFYGE